MAAISGSGISKADKNYHLGHLMLENFKTRSPDDVFQIDAWTGASESAGSMLSRSVRLARALRQLGLQPGDVVMLAGRNHLHLRVPFYAAMFNGLPIVGVDPTFKYAEIICLLKTSLPKILFCDADMNEMYHRAAKDLNIDVEIVTFDGGEYSMADLIEGVNDSLEGFEPALFDQDKVYAWLMCTSGTTGVPKLAACKHSIVMKVADAFIESGLLGKGNRADVQNGQSSAPNYGLNSSPVQWMSGFFNALLMPILHLTILQTSKHGDMGHFIDLVNTYQPCTLPCSPTLVSQLLYNDKHCDFTGFNHITLGGENLHKEMLMDLKKRCREDVTIQVLYGSTETLGSVLRTRPGYPIGSCGTPLPGMQVKLVDPDTCLEITEPNKTGEIWVKSPLLFTEYYNNPEETARVFTQDGWLKTGDLFTRDAQAQGNYYFVDRIKMLIKYRNIQVIPPEIEEVIYSLPAIKECGVVGIPHPTDGEHPVACVVTKPGQRVTKQEINDLVAEKLSDSKQLRGGVIFMDSLPKTSNDKIARHKLKQIALSSLRE